MERDEVRRSIMGFLCNLSAKKVMMDDICEIDLIESGVIDSLGVFQVISFLESSFGISISPSEMVIDHFRRTSLLEDLVLQKLQKSPGTVGRAS
jgi:acyl carrier protein